MANELWWTISVRQPDGTYNTGSGYSPIEAGQDLAKSVAEAQANATQAKQHADDAATALDVLGAILLPPPTVPALPAPGIAEPPVTP